MDFYFTDRSFDLLGIAVAGSETPTDTIAITDDTDDEQAPNGVGRSYTATLVFNDSQIQKVKTMAALGNFVLYKDYRDRYLFMTIMEWTGFDAEAGTLSFVAENGGIDLINETVGAYAATKAMPIADYINAFTADSGFEIGINEIANLTRTLSWDSDSETALARIESVATQFDNAELDFRFEVSGTAVVKRYIDIYKHIGADKSQRLEVNTHLNSIVTTGNIYDLYTSVVAIGGTPEGSDKAVTLAGYKWTDPDGRYVLTDGGVLLDTVANQKWSRLGAGGKAANVKGAYINRKITYTATSQSTLLQSALEGLKAATEPAMNYEVDIVELPDGVNIGDTVHAVDELQDLNLSTRILDLKTSYANGTQTATLGDFLIEANQIDPQYRVLAEELAKQNKGKDGADGLPGAKGADGKTPYFHTAYADSEDGSKNFSITEAGTRAYLGTYTDYTQLDSSDPTKYLWSKIMGPQGVQGLQGPQGDQGIAGPKGTDGKTQYTHIAYANSADGVTDFTVSDSNRTYIGMYVDFTETDSTKPADYSWTLVKGEDGSNGTPGKAGVDGKTPYFHIAYANSADGKDGFYAGGGTNLFLQSTATSGYVNGSTGNINPSSATNEKVSDYISVSASSNYTFQMWGTTLSGGSYWFGIGLYDSDKKFISRIAKYGNKQASDMAEYVSETLTTTSTTAYVRVSFSKFNDYKVKLEKGTPATPWSPAPSEAHPIYMGTYTDYTQADSLDPTAYLWSQIKGDMGDDGLPGKPGVGVNSTTITYQASTSGVTPPTGTWLTSIPSVDAGNYLWTRTIWSYTDGTSETGYSVAKAGEKGDKGDTGATGPTGPKGATGDTGPAGNDITSYASGTTLPTTIAPANSQFWLTNSAGVAIKFYKSNGNAWVEQQISAAAINAATFNGLSFTGVTFNGSTFNSTFANIQPDGFAYKMHGTSTLASGALITDAYNDANVQVSHTELNQTSLIARGFSNGQKLAEINVGQGMMSLGAVYNPTGNSAVWVTGTLTAAQLLAMMRSGTLAWEGTLYPQAGDVATMSINLDQTFSGWLVEWQYFNSGKQDSHYNYTLVPNIWPTYHTGRDLMVQLSMPGVGTFFKQLIVTNTQITGVAANNAGTQAPHAVMSRVFAV